MRPAPFNKKANTVTKKEYIYIYIYIIYIHTHTLSLIDPVLDPARFKLERVAQVGGVHGLEYPAPPLVEAVDEKEVP